MTGPLRIALGAWLAVFALAAPIAGHPGGLAADGCHKERATGTRHCHPERAGGARASSPRPRYEAPAPSAPMPLAGFTAAAASDADDLAALIRRLDPRDRAAIEQLVRTLAAGRE
jgi:hypothetical protein